VAGGGAGGGGPWTVERQPGWRSCEWRWPTDGGAMTGGPNSGGRRWPPGAPEPCISGGRRGAAGGGVGGGGP
jgi:hypothetical protein